MKELKALALVGAALLVFGVFTPIASVPIMGDISLFTNGTIGAAILILLALAAGWMALTERLHAVAWPGGAALAVLALSFYLFERKIGAMQAHVEHRLVGRLLRRLADMAGESVQLQWGWAVMGLGAVLLIGAGLLAARKSRGFERV